MEDIGRMFGFGDPELAENQEIEHTSYGEKLSNSFCGMCIGILLFFGSLGVAGWNEYRNVANMKSINEAKDVVKEATCSPIQSALEGELVHVTCPLSNFKVMGARDPVLQGIPEAQRTGLALDSYMEVYQWNEQVSSKTKDDKVGGGSTTVKTYTYRRDWSFSTPTAVSSFFKQGQSCQAQNNNYACLNWDPERESWWSLSGYYLGNRNIDTATGVKAGDYVLPDSKISRLGDSKVLTPACAGATAVPGSTTTATPIPATTTVPAPASTTTPAATPVPGGTGRRQLQTTTTSIAPAPSTTTAPASTAAATTSPATSALLCAPGGATLQGSKMVWQKQDSNGQTIDYLTRSYSIRTAETVSIMAEQRGDTFVMWESTYDEDYGLFEVWDGNQTAAQMLEQKEAERVGLTWVLRFLTLMFCIIGLVMITAPLTEIPDIIPCVGPMLGDLIGYALWMVDCALGCCCWSVVVAVCWIAYRPMVAIPLLIVSCGLCGVAGYAAYANHQKKKASKMEGKAEEAAPEGDIEVAEEYNPDEPDKE